MHNYLNRIFICLILFCFSSCQELKIGAAVIIGVPIGLFVCWLLGILILSQVFGVGKDNDDLNSVSGFIIFSIIAIILGYIIVSAL